MEISMEKAFDFVPWTESLIVWNKKFSENKELLRHATSFRKTKSLISPTENLNRKNLFFNVFFFGEKLCLIFLLFELEIWQLKNSKSVIHTDFRRYSNQSFLGNYWFSFFYQDPSWEIKNYSKTFKHRFQCVYPLSNTLLSENPENYRNLVISMFKFVLLRNSWFDFFLQGLNVELRTCIWTFK